jgi:hypothetical protein
VQPSRTGEVVDLSERTNFRSNSLPRKEYNRILEFLKRNHGRKLREVMDAEIDISDVIR